MNLIQLIRIWVLSLCCMGYVVAGDQAVPQGTDYSKLNLGDPEKSYRDRKFRAYLPVEEQRRRLKTDDLSRYENPTGIYYGQGESATITLSGSAGQKVQLIIYNSFQADYYDLHEGRNTITVKRPGLAYINYRSDDPAHAPEIRAKLEGGQVSGVMTLHDNTNTWKRLLANAKGDVMDLIGERVHLVYWVEGLRKGCPEDGRALIQVNDRITAYIQDDLLGLSRYGEHTGGHVLMHVVQGGYMSAGGDGVNLSIGTFPGVTDVKSIMRGSWGLAHELGHIFQTRPGMKWIGLTEITNNIAAMYVALKIHPNNLRLECSVDPNLNGESMYGGIYDSYVNNAITQRQIWQFYSGPLPGGLPEPWTQTQHHIFCNLTPLWQLLLYNMEARGKKDFYPLIYRDVRHTDESKMTHGELRVRFFLRACEAAQLDLSEFFVKTGMLVPVDRMTQEYWEHYLTITREMCEKALDEAHRYPKPDSSVIYYISADNLSFFRNKSAVVPPSGAAAPNIKNGRVEIAAHSWKNAVAFEAYGKGKLLRVSLFSLNHPEHDGTTVICPEGTDTVKAVQWDGTRYTVLGDEKHGNARGEDLQKWLEPRALGLISLHEAARAGNLSALQARLTGPIAQYDYYGTLTGFVQPSSTNHVNVDLVNEQGNTPLHVAAAHNRPKTVEALLGAGADCLAKNAADKLPIELTKSKKIKQLLTAAMEKREREMKLGESVIKGDAAAVQKGINEGLNPNAFFSHGQNTLLTAAVENRHKDIVAMLLNSGADPNLAVNNGRTPLLIASSVGDVDIINLLLRKGADPMQPTPHGAYPIHNAIWARNTQAAIRLIPCYKDINYSPDGRTNSYPLVMAINLGNIEVVRAMVRAGIDLRKPPYHNRALLVNPAMNGNAELVRLLLKAGANPLVKNENGKTALEVTKVQAIKDMLIRAEKTHQQEQTLVEGVLKGDTPAVLGALKEHIDPNIAIKDGKSTLLIEAALNMHTEIAAALLQAGADPNRASEDGRTPLLIAASNGDVKLIDLLLKHKADPMICAPHHAYPIHNALWSNHTQAAIRLIPCYKKINYSPDGHGNGYPVDMAFYRDNAEFLLALLDAGLNVTVPPYTNKPMVANAVKMGNEKLVRRLLKAGADPNRASEDGRTPLLIAASNGDVKLIDLLLKHKADPMICAPHHAYPIHNALWGNHTQAAIRLIPCYKKINYSPDGHGNGYPVDMAFNRGNAEFLLALLDAGVNVTIPPYSNKPMVVNAVKMGNEKLVRRLLKAGADPNKPDEEGKRAIDYAQGKIAEILKKRATR